MKAWQIRGVADLQPFNKSCSSTPQAHTEGQVLEAPLEGCLDLACVHLEPVREDLLSTELELVFGLCLGDDLATRAQEDGPVLAAVVHTPLSPPAPRSDSHPTHSWLIMRPV